MPDPRVLCRDSRIAPEAGRRSGHRWFHAPGACRVLAKPRASGFSPRAHLPAGVTFTLMDNVTWGANGSDIFKKVPRAWPARAQSLRLGAEERLLAFHNLLGDGVLLAPR